MNLHVISPGPLTTVQDAGRTGYAARGFRTCGAADGYAMRTANLLAGNPQAAGAAVLEMTLQGGKYQFDGDAVFALAGADMPAALDGRPVPAYTPLLARAGQVLAIGAARSGLRGYLAVFGGVDTPPVLGSRSTDLKCRMGGLDGRALKAGDVLPIGAAPAMVEQRWQQICAKGANRPLGTARTPARPWRFLGGRKLPLFRAVPGPQTDAFTAVGQAAFVHGVYALTADCDRMACKLQGPQIETVDGSDIVSDGIVAGSVQVSANGQPIVMLADHQTTGGYAKIATVISADLSAMAQLRPGEKLYEELMLDSEQDRMTKTAHDKIFIAPPMQIDLAAFYEELQNLRHDAEHNDEGVVLSLQRMVGTYHPNRVVNEDHTVSAAHGNTETIDKEELQKALDEQHSTQQNAQ